MTIKTLFIAPYAAMENLIEECRKEEHELDLQIEIGNLHDGVALAKEAESQGVDVIISRGGTAKLIEEAVRIPVVDVQISGYDMLRVLTIANDFTRKKAIVGFSNITLGAKAIIDLLEIPIDIYTIDSENEIEPLLTKLKHEGYELIMGDVVTFQTASQLQLIGILIQSGREAIADAFKEAKAINRWLTRSKLETTRFKSILKATAGDLMILSNKGEVLYEQWKTFDARPTVGALFESKLNLKNPLNREVIQVKDISGIPLKLVQTKLEQSDSTYYVIEFFQLDQNKNSQVLKTSVVSPPLLIHQSEAMISCLALINKCLSYKNFVLIGENGSGKELIARYIHFNKFNENGLLGLIKAADLVSLSPETFDPEIKTLYIQSIDQLDKRFITKFNQHIDSLEHKGKVIIFSITQERNLLFNRIYEKDVSRIPIPALVDRKEDIKELVTSFILHFHQTLGTSPMRITDKGLALLETYDWPGNVMELKALIKDAVLMEKGYVIDDKLVTSLLKHKRADSDPITPDLLNGSLESIEKKIIERVLEEEDFNQTKAAKRLNINRSTLWRKLKSNN